MFASECDGGCCWHELVNYTYGGHEYKWLCCWCGTMSAADHRGQEHGALLVTYQKHLQPEDWAVWRRTRERQLKNELIEIELRRERIKEELKNEA